MSADFSDVPLDYAAGPKSHPVKNIDRLDQPPLDRLAHPFDHDTTFQHHTERNAGRDRRPYLGAWIHGRLLGNS
jgi:hypothetical protein